LDSDLYRDCTVLFLDKDEEVKQEQKRTKDYFDQFENYSQEIPRNNNGINASRNLNEIARGLRDRYSAGATVSPTFCKLKFESIESSAKTIQHVVGSRPR
jgi:hypothetical protein